MCVILLFLRFFLLFISVFFYYYDLINIWNDFIFVLYLLRSLCVLQSDQFYEMVHVCSLSIDWDVLRSLLSPVHL